MMLVLLLRRSERLPSDIPNARSLHDRVIPRGGGVAIFAGWFAGTLWLPSTRPWLGPLVAIIAVSLWDDIRPLPPLIRLAVHAVAASVWAWLAPSTLPLIVAVIIVVWTANLYNFMDGSDGLAAAMTVIGFGAYTLAATFNEGPTASTTLALVAATSPFLAFNWPPAKIFMGDVGSVPIGFLAGVLGIEGWASGVWPAWFPVLVFLVFIADATMTLIRRLLSRATVWEAHREHHYQRLVQMRCGHQGTLVLYASLMAMTGVTALVAMFWFPAAGGPLLAAWIVVLVVVFVGIGYHWQRKSGLSHESKD